MGSIWWVGITLVIVAGALAFLWWLMIAMPGNPRKRIPGLTEEEKRIKQELQNDLKYLAGLGPKHIDRRGQLHEAENWIFRNFKEAGLEPEKQQFQSDEETVANVETEIPGDTRSNEVIVIGAHYDTVVGSPGANDNGSGVVALLALARRLSRISPQRTVRLVAFVNEEHPFSKPDQKGTQMGSVQYARRCRIRNEYVRAMITLETIGYYTVEPNTQRFPSFLKYIFPDTGNFVAVISNIGSRWLAHSIVKSYRQKGTAPTLGVVLPTLIKGITRSDHSSFWHEGYPGVMITDTANFRYPFYHSSQDTVDKIEFDTFSRVVYSTQQAIEDLAK